MVYRGCILLRRNSVTVLSTVNHSESLNHLTTLKFLKHCSNWSTALHSSHFLHVPHVVTEYQLPLWQLLFFLVLLEIFNNISHYISHIECTTKLNNFLSTVNFYDVALCQLPHNNIFTNKSCRFTVRICRLQLNIIWNTDLHEAYTVVEKIRSSTCVYSLSTSGTC